MAPRERGDIPKRNDERVDIRARDRGRAERSDTVAERHGQAKHGRFQHDHAILFDFRAMHEHVGGAVERGQSVDIDETKEADVDAALGGATLQHLALLAIAADQQRAAAVSLQSSQRIDHVDHSFARMQLADR